VAVLGQQCLVQRQGVREVVDDEHVRVHENEHAERQPHAHARGIHLDRLIEKVPDAGELFDFVSNRVRIETAFRQNPRALPGLNKDFPLAVAKPAE